MAKELAILGICDPNATPPEPPAELEPEYWCVTQTDGETVLYSNCHERWYDSLAKVNRPGYLCKTEEAALALRDMLAAGGEGEVPT